VRDIERVAMAGRRHGWSMISLLVSEQ
jgi:hypothetical protein